MYATRAKTCSSNIEGFNNLHRLHSALGLHLPYRARKDRGLNPSTFRGKISFPIKSLECERRAEAQKEGVGWRLCPVATDPGGGVHEAEESLDDCIVANFVPLGVLARSLTQLFVVDWIVPYLGERTKPRR